MASTTQYMVNDHSCSNNYFKALQLNEELRNYARVAKDCPQTTTWRPGGRQAPQLSSIIHTPPDRSKNTTFTSLYIPSLYRNYYAT